MKKLIIAMMIIALVVVMAVSVSAAEAPATDFEYEVVGEAVTIKKYKGTATEVEIPATIESKPVTVIGESAFNDIRTITKVVIPNGVKTIEKQAFYNARGLVEINIPDSVETIGDDAYYACIAAKTLTIGKGVKTVGEQAFSRFAILETLTVASECTALKAENGCLIDVAKKTVLTGEAKETVIIPTGVEAIGDYAFYGPGTGKGTLKNVVIPDGVTYVGEQAFSATALESVVLPKSATKVLYAAFANNNLRSGKVYYEGAEEDLKNILSTSSKGVEVKIGEKDSDGEATANNNLILCTGIQYGSCMNNTNGWTHSEGETCTYCTPAGGQTPSTPNAPQTGSSVTVLAVVAVVALAATSVVISKRRIED